MSEVENQELKKSALLKVSDFFTEAPSSIKQTIEQNNQSFWNKLEEKNKLKKELQASQLKQSNLSQDQEVQDKKLDDLLAKIVQIQNNYGQEDLNQSSVENEKQSQNDSQEITQEVNVQNNEKKIDQLKNFFMESSSVVSNKASSSFDQLKQSLKKKEEEKKNKNQKQEQINQNTQTEISDELNKENNELLNEKDNSELKKNKIDEQSKQEITQEQQKKGNQNTRNSQQSEQSNILPQIENHGLNQKNEENYEIEEIQLNEQSQQIEKSQLNEDTQQTQENQKTPKEKQIQKLGEFFTNSSNVVSLKAQESFQQFKEKLQEKQKQKMSDQVNESYQKTGKEDEDRIQGGSNQSLEKSQLVSKIIPHNSHYEEEMEKERKRQNKQRGDNSYQKSSERSGSDNELNSDQEENQKNQSFQQDEKNKQNNISIKKYTLKRKNSKDEKKGQNKTSNQNPNQNHVYVRHFVEKEIDKEEKLREVARKKREIELQLLQVNQELIHLRNDVSNEAKAAQEQYVVKKGKFIPPIKEQGQVKAMIQISDDKKALEGAMSLVRRMNQERKLKEQLQLQKMHQNSDNFKNKLLAYRERDEENFYQKELQKKNVVLTRMQEYELKKIEGQRLQDASRQFVKDLMEKGPNKGKVSEVYKSKINEIEKELDVNLSHVRSSKLQTPLLDQKKQNLQNVRNLQEYQQTEEDDNLNERVIDEDQYGNDEDEERDEERVQELHQKSVQQKRENTHQQHANHMQSSLPIQKKSYGSIFTKRVINYDQKIKNQDKVLSEEKKNLYEKRMNYSKVVKHKYTPKSIVDSYNFYQDAVYLKQKMKVSDQMNMDYYRPEQKQPFKPISSTEEYVKYSKEPTNYIEVNRAWKVHNKVILNHEYPQSEQIKKLKY